MFDLDSHKLIYHPAILTRYLDAPHTCPPVTVEVSPTERCNQQCVFCAFDYTPRKVDLDLRYVYDNVMASSAAPRSIVWGGEGEPTLNQDFGSFLASTPRGLTKFGLITNGTWANLPKYLKAFTWVRFSINAGSPERYAEVHGVKEQVFSEVLENLRACTKRIREEKLETTIGVQLLLIPDTVDQIMEVGNVCDLAKVHYYVIKPYSRHPQSAHLLPTGFNAKLLKKKLEHTTNLHTPTTYRERQVDCFREPKQYSGCLAAPFFHFIAATGTVYPCPQFVSKQEWALGNIYYQTLREICSSRRRQELMTKLFDGEPLNHCRHPCRLNESNIFMSRILNPQPHDWFL